MRERVEGEGQADSMLSVEPHAGLDPITPRSWPELKARAGHSINRATQALHVAEFISEREATSSLWVNIVIYTRREARVRDADIFGTVGHR